MDLRELPAQEIAEVFPITSITLELTKRCPLACSYCFAHCWNKEVNQADLTPEMGRKVIDWLMSPRTNGNAASVDISFWGGEPLLKWELLKDLVLYAEEKSRETGIHVTFGGTTNVVLLTPDKFDFLQEHNIYFLLSIDGTQEHHDEFRKFPNGSGSWDVIMKNVEPILARWPFYKVRLSFTAEHIGELLTDIQCLYSKGFKDIIYSPVSEGDWNEDRLSTLRTEFDKIAKWYQTERDKGNEIKIKYIDDACNQVFSPMGDNAPCGAGRNYVGVAIDGSIWPCHRFVKLDDLRPWHEKSTCLGQVEYGIINSELRSNFTNWRPENLQCEKCKAFKVSCTGGCWASNFDLNGDITKPTQPLCTVSQVNIEIAKRMIESDRRKRGVLMCSNNDITHFLTRQLDILNQTIGD